MEEALAYSRTLKKRLHDEQETYNEVVTILRSYKRRMIDPASVKSKVQTLLHGKNDLILGFNKFLPKHHAITVHEYDADNKSPLIVPQNENVVRDDLQQFHNPLAESAEGCDKFLEDHDNEQNFSAMKSAVEFINRVRKSLNNDDMYKTFLDAMAGYKKLEDMITVEQVVSALLQASPEIYFEFTTTLADSIAKTDNGIGMMNKKNLRENIMNHYEDDMHEQDMLVLRVESTIKAMERLHQECEKKPTETTEVEDHLSVINLRCVERLYDESGLDMLNILRRKPRAASRLILSRLRKKFDELKENRCQANSLRVKIIKKIHG